MKLDARLNDWKKKLLDLGKRNALINYKLDSKSVVNIVDPSPQKLWDKLVENEKAVQFPYITESDDAAPADEKAASYPYGELCVDRPVKDVQRTLRNLRKKYRTFVEEQDVNVLYLSFGFLEWTEKGFSKQSMTSPLILVPVSLRCDSIKSPITLKITDDEIVLNPTLSYRLKQDFGVELPEFHDEDFGDIWKILEEFSKKHKWTLRNDVSLGILSFLKINMYKDLDSHKDTILNHPVINALAGNPELLKKAMADVTVDDISCFNHDSVAPDRISNVVDADSSQQDAILCATRGISFVLQGPPGTGKSQTITNIISSLLAQGKKVLFVSEKKAALDVVHKRLKESGLEDFCLSLHSNKANKKETLAQLENVLQISHNQAKMADSAKRQLTKLSKDREQLNAYAQQLNTPVAPLNSSIFQANGIISSYDGIEDVSFPIPLVKDTTEEGLREYISLLSSIASHITQMNDDCRTNPWYRTTVTRMTNAFLHDLGELRTKLTDAFSEYRTLWDVLKEGTDLSGTNNLEGARKLKTLLDVAAEAPTQSVPREWLDPHVRETLASVIDREETNQKEYREARQTVLDVIDRIHGQNGSCPFSMPDFTPEYVKSAIDDINKAIEADCTYRQFRDEPAAFDLATSNISASREYIETDGFITSQYNRDIFAYGDIKAMEMRFKYSYASFLRVFKPGYWSDMKVMKLMSLHPEEKKNYQSVVEILEKAVRHNELYEQINSQKAKMSQLFPDDYKDLDTDFDAVTEKTEIYSALKAASDALETLSRIFKALMETEDDIRSLLKMRYDGFDTDWTEARAAQAWVEKLCTARKAYSPDMEDESSFEAKICCDESYRDTIRSSASQLDTWLTTSKPTLDSFASLFSSPEEILSLSFDELDAKVNDCADDTASLELWLDYVSDRTSAEKKGLGEFMKLVEEKPIAGNEIVPVFEKRFYRLWIDAILPDYPAVESFRHEKHEKLIADFASLDRQQLEIAQARIRTDLINALPPLDSFTTGEVNILKKELSKQRKIMPLRKLFSKIPNLLMTLKPCLMMSPLSVSQFLESDCYRFDTVIFDEASQVKTENAIGAICRGAQLIVAGDTHQLPPTNFFTSQASDDDFDSDENNEEEESIDSSILDEAVFLPSRELLWHYRSRHEHLIAFSNAAIYKNRLVTYPSNIDRAEDWGVEYTYVEDGVYNGKGPSRGNVREAEKVAEIIFQQIEKHPERSIGVITFGVVQETCIESVLNRMRREHPEHEAFFSEDKPEAFFVKSLENVQGDERDTIIFSIGYAKDANGKMAMRFGPLSMIGGERRLNVAVTRAKYNVKLIGSLKPTDIDTSRVSQEGPKLLRKYIEFASTGPSVLEDVASTGSLNDCESPFESSVAAFLEAEGYKVTPQVGCSGFRIDLGIEHPEYSGIYALGIECDGASYHSSRTARERDRLRQGILESMGWNIYRIWSTDWIKDPVSEKKRLLAAVENAIESYVPGSSGTKHEEAPADDGLSGDNPLIQFSEKEVRNEVHFAEYVPYLTKTTMAETELYKLSKYLQSVIDNESPVHYDIVCQRAVSVLVGKEKVTPTVKTAVNQALIKICTSFTRKDDFLYTANPKKTLTVRKAGARSILQISEDELALGMKQIVGANFGLTEEELIRETAKQFGFSKVGPNIGERLGEIVRKLNKEGFIDLKDGKILLTC